MIDFLNKPKRVDKVITRKRQDLRLGVPDVM